MLSISVQDTGVGIPLEKQPHLFEAFTQAHTGGARRHFGAGTGLGLCITAKLAKLMGCRQVQVCVWVIRVGGRVVARVRDRVVRIRAVRHP